MRLVPWVLPLMLLALPGASSAATATAVEYIDAAWGYYFVTATPDEIAFLDGGAFGGAWQRTGATFPVWDDDTAGGEPTCRFFGVAFAPRSSHFYTPYAAECATRKSDPAWRYESVAFYLGLPDSGGECAPGTDILFRLFNNGAGGAPNHRYTTSVATFQQMRAAGWTAEGDTRTGAFACVPHVPGTTASAEGLYAGTASNGQTVSGVVLANGSFHLLYAGPADSVVRGVIRGTISFADGSFNSYRGRDMVIGENVYGAFVSGSYLPRQSIGGTLSEFVGGRSFTFTAAYDARYERPATLAAVAGDYMGLAASSAGRQAASASIAPDGALVGSAPGCTFSGTVAPHGTINAYDVTLDFRGPLCEFRAGRLTGVAYYDEATQALRAVATDTTAIDTFLFVGVK